MVVRRLLAFPNPVNEVAARLVAAGVVLLCATILVSRQTWLLIPLAYGFVARVLTGPKLSPLGQLVTRVVVPRLPIATKPVAGPPKRFAQGIGATLSVGALVAALAGATTLAFVLVAMILVGRHARVGLRHLSRVQDLRRASMRVGVIPASVCADCADISGRLAASSAR